MGRRGTTLTARNALRGSVALLGGQLVAKPAIQMQGRHANPFTRDEMIRRCLIRRYARLKTVGTTCEGEKVSLGDVDFEIKRYVEDVPGFMRALPVLDHKYWQMRDIDTFVAKLATEVGPGSNFTALCRLDWLEYAAQLEESPSPEWGRIVLKGFERAIDLRMQFDPFFLPLPEVTEDPAASGDPVLYICREHAQELGGLSMDEMSSTSFAPCRRCDDGVERSVFVYPDRWLRPGAKR